MRIFILNIESFQILLPVFSKNCDKFDIMLQLLFAHWQTGYFLLCLEDFVLQLFELHKRCFFIVIGEMESELTFWWDVWSNVATAGAVIFGVNEFHEGLVSLLINDKVLFHLFFDKSLVKVIFVIVVGKWLW